MEVIGKISMVFNVRSGVSQRTGEQWVSQDFMIEYFWWQNQTTASKILFNVFGAERIKDADLKEGEEVKVRYHIEAREYNGRMFNDVRYDGIEHIHRVKPSQAEPEKQEEPVKEDKAKAEPMNTEATDDLPF